MKIVIDLSDKIYDTILDDEMPTNEQMKVIVQRIYEGVPLPNDHGDLIDKGDVLHDIDCDEEMRLGKNVEWVREVVRNAPTIIKASEEGAVG